MVDVKGLLIIKICWVQFFDSAGPPLGVVAQVIIRIVIIRVVI